MSITQWVHRSFQATPGAVATQFEGRRRTFAELRDRIGRLATALRALGVRPGDRCALIGQNTDRFVESLLALSWIGAIFHPLNSRWSAAELAYVLDDSGTQVIIVDDAFWPVVEELQRTPGRLREVIYSGDGEAPVGTLSFEQLIADSAFSDDVESADGETAGLFYTGGTTGRPKGVALTQRNLIESAQGGVASGPHLATPGRMLHAAPLFHLAGVWPWLVQLLRGGEHVILRSFTPKAVADAIVAHEIADILLVPTMLQMLVAHLEQSGTKLPSLRSLMYAGSPIPEAVLHRTEAVLPGIRLTQIYGMTELSPVATVLLPEDHVGPHRRSAGRAASHARVQVVDLEDRELPRGGIGEILVRGAHVMKGYWGQPELTATTLRGGWMHTGDVGYMDEEGFLFVVDRLKDVIITGGENVYSAEVENVVAAHPAVAQCAVIGLPDAEWGERVHAVVVVAAGASLTFDELRAFVATHIARYKAPRSLEIVTSLPISSAGKVLKSELRSRQTSAAT